MCVTKFLQDITVHENMEAYQCIFCEEKFGRQGNLKVHVKSVHEKPKAYNCDSCEKSFGLKGTLDKHIITVHENLKSHKCVSCDKILAKRVIWQCI